MYNITTLNALLITGGKCTNLINYSGLSLYDNQLTGEIPQEVCDLIESNNLSIDYGITPGNDLTNTCD